MELKTENLQEVIFLQAVKICELEKEFKKMKDSRNFWNEEYDKKEQENKNLLNKIESLNNKIQKSNIIIGISHTDEL